VTLTSELLAGFSPDELAKVTVAGMMFEMTTTSGPFRTTLEVLVIVTTELKVLVARFRTKPDFAIVMAALRVRREKAALSRWVKPPPGNCSSLAIERPVLRRTVHSAGRNTYLRGRSR